MNAKILIVDDEGAIRDMLERHFKYLGYDVKTAENGKAALNCLNNEKIDLVLTDIMMPEMTGVELLKNIRIDYPMVRTVVMTGHVTMDNALSCIRYGADRCVFKPLNDLTILEKAVAEGVERIRYWNQVLKDLRGIEND